MNNVLTFDRQRQQQQQQPRSTKSVSTPDTRQASADLWKQLQGQRK